VSAHSSGFFASRLVRTRERRESEDRVWLRIDLVEEKCASFPHETKGLTLALALSRSVFNNRSLP
jgi:hypothetical protein